MDFDVQCRITAALESIAASLMKLANPPQQENAQVQLYGALGPSDVQRQDNPSAVHRTKPESWLNGV